MDRQAGKTGPRGFQDALIAACGRFQVTAGPAPAPAGTGRVLRGSAGGLDLVAVSAPPGAISRDSGAIRRDPGRHLFLIRQCAGRARMDQDGSRADLSPGDFFLADSARPSVFGYRAAARQVSLHLPHEVTRGAGLTGGLVLRGGSAAGLALARAVARLDRDGPDRMLRLLQLAARGQVPPGTGLAATALALIAAGSRDPALTPARLALDLGVHLRQLQRALADLGQTPSGAIESARMADARALLRACPRMTVTGIAAMAGFPDISRFMRAFRARHGQSPGAWRAANAG